MADLLSFRFEGDKGFIEGRASDLFSTFVAKQLLKEAVDDIADKIEAEARIQAPLGPSGELKAHPVERSDTTVSVSPERFSSGFGQMTSIPLFGGGTAVRGPKGRFIKPELFRSPVFRLGEVLAQSILSVPEEPRHAMLVHGGTGVYGPRRKMITASRPGGFMQFPASRWPTAIFKRSIYRFKAVKGQRANPYLERAFLIIDSTYVPARIELLRAEIAAIT